MATMADACVRACVRACACSVFRHGRAPVRVPLCAPVCPMANALRQFLFCCCVRCSVGVVRRIALSHQRPATVSPCPPSPSRFAPPSGLRCAGTRRGLGITVSPLGDNGGMMVVTVVPDGPADKLGNTLGNNGLDWTERRGHVIRERRSIPFRLGLRTCALWGVRVVSLTKSRNMPTTRHTHTRAHAHTHTHTRTHAHMRVLFCWAVRTAIGHCSAAARWPLPPSRPGYGTPSHWAHTYCRALGRHPTPQRRCGRR